MQKSNQEVSKVVSLIKNYKKICLVYVPLICLTWICLVFANSVDPDQLASKEAN